MSYPPAPPPGGGVNPYGSDDEQHGPAGSVPPVPPPPAGPGVPPPAGPSSQPGLEAPMPWDNPNPGPAQSWGSPAAAPQPWAAQNDSPYLSSGPYGSAAPGGYGAYPMPPTQRNSLGTWSLVLALVSIFMCWLPVVNIGLAIAAVIVGFRARSAVQAGQANNGGVATAGIVIGFVAIGVSVLGFLGVVANLATLE